MPEQLFEIARRTFDTPEFRGIEFIEAECKTIINQVPGNYLPFKYTINPYRGCSHACEYCQIGETPILMGDGRTKPLADVEVGDEVYGTVAGDKYHYYVKTRVLAHWSTVKTAYRITLVDGTELVASGDHRYLSNRGWKYVTGSEQGPDQRPHLTLRNKLMGTGRFAIQPIHDTHYRYGYLCGMIRGDGHLSTDAAFSSTRVANQFRLALVDLEALRRTREYLTEFDIATREFLFQEAVGARKALSAISASGRTRVYAIEDICSIPTNPSDSWRKGFLAGIFDAEGSYSCGILRIANTNAIVIERLVHCLRRFGFRFRLEVKKRKNPVVYVCVLGGVREHLRFFHTVDPAITRKRSIDGQAIKSNAPLGVEAVEPLGVDLPMYDITTGTGDFIANGVVSHNCFARPTHTYLDMNAGKDFESKIVVKVNAPDVLRRQLGAKKWKGEGIAMGTNTDPYQRAEGRYKLMPRIIEALSDYRNPFSILTKGTLILRDLDRLVEAANVTEVTTAFSIGTLDEDVWRTSEPGTPHPKARMEAVAALNEAGIPCGILMAPVLPGISDRPDQLRAVVVAAIDAGATHVSPILLHLRPGVREEFMPWLAETYPDLVPRYEQMYRTPYGPPGDRNALGDAVGDLIRELGGTRPAPERPRRWRTSERPRGEKAEQLELL
ncbi:MAG TPA: intein-containing Rv2578c family radical SAM protein [Actinomycetota bacterium]|jgi:DNA repair photolyase|nr:intein-containing Rv2578c family radical SAM protein [Actinomycetota bacterium]